MQKWISLCLLAIGLCLPSFAQTIKVQPYLQNATPNSIYILWETDSGDESEVEWGLSEDLGNTSTGTSMESSGAARIHEVNLTGLERFTTYFYRVKTGTTFSEIHTFKTPPFAFDKASFQLIAMSDMQRDGNNPNKFFEIIEDGVITYLEDTNEGNLSDNLALVLIPGDLVVNGTVYSQWEEHFFTPAQDLMSEVPVYPVPGNHEYDAMYFFQYFNLPENGSPGFEEHWWYKDYGNVRIVGMDSNGAYASQEQLDWLEDVLDNTCTSDSINFVFAQLHHPHKSELWLPGESDFTGAVIERLESFSTECAKPSIHFFGHTHGYSRGQSRDHKHLWINAATAGGAIDNWGEFPQFDYDEFSVSQDEWGFVAVEVSAGDDPQFTVKRISRGNETTFRDNEITDVLTVKLNDASVNTPTPLFPIDEEVRPECVILKADEFDHPTALHGQSHWQIATNCNDFSDPVAERWLNFENHYFNEDTQAGDDLTDEKIIGLEGDSDYCWRVRYRDRELNWSGWSAPASFSTSAQQSSPNLLINPGAENDLFEWTTIEGVVEALTDGECNGISPHTGDKYFAVGGVCEDGAFGKCFQNINVISFADSIDAGNAQANFGGYLSNYSGSDLPAMRLLFYTIDGILLDSTQVFSSLNSEWTMFSEWADLPLQTRVIQFELTGTRNAGNDNDSYFDDLFLKIGTESEECSNFVVSTKIPHAIIPNLSVIPNPWSTNARILLPNINTTELELVVTDILGQQVSCPTVTRPGEIQLEKGNLQAGTYYFVLRNGTEIVGNGRFMVH